jgi:molecular chaperone HscB
VNPFETLGVEARFDLRLTDLERRHRELSRTLHPDRYAGAPAAERRMALGKAIEVNEAFRALRDPVKRAEALCRALGLAVGETSEPPADPELLMEMMEAREELAEAHRNRDLPKIGAIGATMRARQARTLQTLGERFRAGMDDASKLGAVLPVLGELRYLKRLLDEVDAFEEHLSE